MNALAHQPFELRAAPPARLADPADRPAIAAFVAPHPEATAFHRPEWLDAVSAGTGARTHWLVAGEGPQIEAVLPLSEVGSPLFGRALVSSGFAVGGGVLEAWPGAGSSLFEAASELARRLSCPGIELRGGPLPDADGWHVKREAHAGFVRSLAADDEAELLAIPRKQRAEVRRGLAGALQVRCGRDAVLRQMHYSVYAESVRNLGTPVFPRALFEAVLENFGDDADILVVLDGQTPVSAVLSLYHAGAVLPFWGGGVWAARNLRANEVMYYALMNHARRRGCKSFDFGRSKVDSGAWHFKRNWGFVPESLAYAHWTADGTAPRDVNPLSPKYRARIALWRKLPLPVANVIGPAIARGLG